MSLSEKPNPSRAARCSRWPWPPGGGAGGNAADQYRIKYYNYYLSHVQQSRVPGGGWGGFSITWGRHGGEGCRRPLEKTPRLHAFLHPRASSGARRERRSGEMSMCFQINKALFNQNYESGLSAWQQDGRCAAAVLSASRRLLYVLCPSFFFLLFFSSPCLSPFLLLCSVPSTPHPPPTPPPLPLPPACV